MITEATLARFAREVAKYPPEQKQSAVMACLSIVQQEQGYVSVESEAVIADYLGMAQIGYDLFFADKIQRIVAFGVVTEFAFKNATSNGLQQ